MNSKISKRSKNFSEREKAVLVRLIEQNAHILENKKTDALTNKIKKETWENITAQFNTFNAFNADFSGPRDSKQLRILYDNMKRTVRKELAEENKIQSLIRMNPIIPDITRYESQIKSERKSSTEKRLNECEKPKIEKQIEDRIFQRSKEELRNSPCRSLSSPTCGIKNPEKFNYHKPLSQKKILSKKIRLYRSCESIKRQYLLKKLQIANFELRSKFEQHALDMDIKKLQLELLEKQLNSM